MVSKRCVWAISGLLVFLASPLPAQVPSDVSTPAQLQAVLHPGYSVEVVTEDGRTVSGRVHRVAEDELLLNSGGALLGIPATNVVEVTRLGDSVWDGVIKGALWGAAAGFAQALIVASGGETDDANAAGSRMLSWTAIAAGFGLLFDQANLGRTVVYRSQASRVSVAPIVTSGQRGLRVTWRF